MSEFEEGVQAKMDVVLEEAWGALPNGGVHETRSFIAEELIRCEAAAERSR
jgi:hypothetical protein